MKLNKKFTGVLTLGLATMLSFTSCVGDLDVEPIDPSVNTPNNVLTGDDAFTRLLGKAYAGLAVSGHNGDDSDINGIDAGFGQYLRGLFNLQELPTDEAVMGWNDQTIKDLHGLQWGSSDVFVSAMFYRLTQQIAVCNEIIRQLKATDKLDDAKKTQYIAEARAIRDLSYLHGIDMFGGMPFATEDNAMTALPGYKSRAELYKWLTEEELPAVINDLPANPEKYRAGKGMALMMLAKLYLNGKVYAGVNDYAKCVDVCKQIIDLGYQLESKENWKNMFGAENDKYLGVGHEIIFSVFQDHNYTQTYGGMTYIINAECGGNMDYKSLLGLGGSGWGGTRVTPEFADKFSASDVRYKFYTDGQTKEITDIGSFNSGWAYTKFTNLKDDGTMIENANSFPDTDFPVFRLADVYLMLAECQVVGGATVNVNGHDGIWYFNQIRNRAGIAELQNVSAQNILDERARELSWECWRRSDLIRFNKFTNNYVWSYKGMNSNSGAAHNVNSKYALFPIPAKEISNNGNLQQNPGY
jgi:hypothetical protein